MVFQCACIGTNGCNSQKVPLTSAALWSVVLPVLLLYKHADECCDQRLPLVLAQVLMWSSLVLFLLTCNTWDSKQKIKVVNKSLVVGTVL